MASDERDEASREPGSVMDLGMVTGDPVPAGGTGHRTDVIGAGKGTGPRDRRWVRWWPLLAATVIVAAVAIHHGATSGSAGRQPEIAATGTASAGDAGAGQAGPSGAGGIGRSSEPVVTQYFDHPFLGLYSSWELYGLGPTNVVRIEFAKARITRTEFPPLRSGGPVSFAVDGAGAVVRPLDHVAGYRVPDNQPAEPLDNALGSEGPALPGPDPGSYWVPTSSGAQDAVELVDDHGKVLGPRIDIPHNMSRIAQPDGTGYLILTDETGEYRARPSGLNRITDGELLAIGPHRWLVDECDDRHDCARIAIDRETGRRRVIDHVPPQPVQITGAISPDGRYAALVELDGGYGYQAHLIDLASGADRDLSVPIADDASGSIFAWSPDSTWLFAAGRAGELFPIHPSTGKIDLFKVPVPPVSQLIIRAGGPPPSAAPSAGGS